MRFQLIDRVIEQSEDRVVAIRAVSAGEEYLQDHFPGFPILPGVFMLEAMVQAARACEEARAPRAAPWVLGQVRALKYGAMVRPGATMRIEVTRGKADDDGGVDYRGTVTLVEPGPDASTPGAPQPEPVQAASGRLTMRPARVTLA